MKVAAIQFRCESDHQSNLRRAASLVHDAAAQGAVVIVLPELFASLARSSVMRQEAETIDGLSMQWARTLAAHVGATLVPGSFVERDGERFFNTASAIGPDGEIIATYRKVHLFDIDLAGATSRESEMFSRGVDATVVDLGHSRLGLTVCYDLRFPELFRIETLLGADLIAVPSAFTARTGRDHWELLVRARAVENQTAIIAAAQWGTSPDGIDRYGHSMIVDAWGRILAQTGGEDDAVLVANVDLEGQANIRRRLPSLTHRRPEAYRWPD